MSGDLLVLWGLTEAQLAAMPAPARADLEAATEQLRHYIKPDRLHDVVRRPAPATGGRSLLEWVHEGRTADVREHVQVAFDLRRIVR